MNKSSILIVDDEKSSRLGISYTLQGNMKDQVHVDEVENGRKALKLLRMNKYDLLLTDIRMPGMTGLHLLEELRETDNHITCILLTGYADFEYAQKGLQLGASDYLLKPIDQDELVSAVQRELKIIQEERKKQEKFQYSTSIQDATVSRNEYIEMATEYIRRNLHQPLSAIDVANYVHLNPNYFSVLFKEEKSITFTDYLTNLRMERAKGLLITTNFSLENITEQIGYQSTSYFIRIFKKLEGVTPKKYRDQIKHGTK